MKCRIFYCMVPIADFNSNILAMDIDNDWYTLIKISYASVMMIHNPILKKDEQLNILRKRIEDWLWPIDENFDLIGVDLMNVRYAEYLQSSWGEETSKKLTNIYTRWWQEHNGVYHC